ncbi:hypothetical protein D3C77_431500 [compost metagenome]
MSIPAGFSAEAALAPLALEPSELTLLALLPPQATVNIDKTRMTATTDKVLWNDLLNSMFSIPPNFGLTAFLYEPSLHRLDKNGGCLRCQTALGVHYAME